MTDVDLGALRYYAIAEGSVAGIPALVARTGYTGEDGFEVFVDTARTGELWDALLDGVRAVDGVPVGLGARDTLRLEAGMPLYGNELDLETTPFDANLARVVKLGKAGDFVGRAALERVAADGPSKRLVGLVVEGRGIARHGVCGPRRRPADRGRHQRDPVAHPGRADRDGLRRAGGFGDGYHGRRGGPRRAGPRKDRRPAVLPPPGLGVGQRSERWSPAASRRARRRYARDGPR